MTRRRTTASTTGRRIRSRADKGMCGSCRGTGETAIAGMAYSPERGVYRLTGTLPCHRCRADEYAAARAMHPDLGGNQ